MPDEEEPAPRRRRLLPVIPLLIAGLVLVAGISIYAVYHYVIKGPGDKPPGGTGVTGETVNQTRITVAKKDGVGNYKSVKEALQNAKSGQHIVILDSRWDEVLNVSRDEGKGVVIEADPKKEVIWQMPSGFEATQIIRIDGAEGLTIRNLSLLGNNGKTRSGIAINGSSSGIVLEDLLIRDMVEAGVSFRDTMANENNPATIQRVRVVGNGDPTVNSNEGFLFSALADTKGPKPIFGRNDWITISDCRLEGPFRSGGVVFEGNNTNIKIEKNRFWKMADAISFRDAKIEPKANPTYSYQVKIENNTLQTITGFAIHFKNAGQMAQKQNFPNFKIELERNYFCKTNVILKTDDNPPQPNLFPMTWADNARDRTTKEGTVSINSQIVDWNFSTDPDDDKTFLRYGKKTVLNSLPPSNKSIGALPIAE